MALRLKGNRYSRVGAERPVRMRVLQRKNNDAAAPFMELVTKETEGGTKQLQDPFGNLYSANNIAPEYKIIQPLHDPGRLILVSMQNSALNQCIDAYVVNIESYGYQLEYVGPIGEEKGKEQQAELTRLRSFLECPNGDKSLREVRENSRRDLERVGYRYFEISRDSNGVIGFFDHVPSPTMRKTIRDKEATPYKVQVPDPDGDGFISKTFSKYFRRYVQIGFNGSKVYFKEFGDPRPIDPKDGKVNDNLAIEDQATEIFEHGLYMPGSAYGLPRWIGAIPDMLGMREAEMVNLNFFRENAIPAMVCLISGGLLTNESFDNVTNIINSARGRDAMNRILILEAAADDSSGTMDANPPTPRITMQPMNDARQSDGQFKDYQQGGARKVRSTMRLPAIYTGDTEEYSRATADSGQRVAENQVFSPERSMFDEFMNTRVLPTHNIRYWRFKTMGPTVYDPDMIGNLIDKMAKHGGLTPNILVKIANQVFDVQIPAHEGEWGDIPLVYALAMANQGIAIDGMEDLFSIVNDLANPALNPDGSDPADDPTEDPNAPPVVPTDPNAPLTKSDVVKLKRQLRRELLSITNEAITALNDAVETRKVAA